MSADSRPGELPRSRAATGPHIAWITNLSAPYRHPVWAAMAEQCRLSVGLLAVNEPNRQWDDSLPQAVRRLRLRTLGPRGHNFLPRVLLGVGLPGGLDAVVLPGWEMPVAWQLLLEAKLRRIRTVAFYESSPGSHRFTRGPVAMARRLFFRAVDVIVTVGSSSQQAVLGFGVAAERVVATFNAVDVQGIHDAARRLGGPATERADHLLFVGQLIDRKNVDGLLKAFAQLPATARVVIAGVGPEERALQVLASDLGVADRVDFRGYVGYDDMPTLLSQASTLVLASRSEVYGLVVVEALAAGLHVVVSRSCGVLADVRDLPGVYVTDTAPESIAAAIADSQAAWHGPLVQPVILGRTPEAMARAVLRACLG